MRVTCEATFESQSAAKTGIVRMKFRAPLSELTNTVSVLGFLHSQNKTFGLGAVVEGEKIPIGAVELYQYTVNKDGETILTFNSDLSHTRLGTTDMNRLLHRSMTLVMGTGLKKPAAASAESDEADEDE